MNDEKRIKKEVKALAKQEEYEKIYYQYGPKWFRKYVSEDYKEKDINKLRAEGRYIDIYTKYGKLDLESKIKERKERKGKQLHTENGGIFRCIACIKEMIGYIIGAQATMLLIGPIITDIQINNNKHEYEKEIEEYQKEIEEYAEKFDISTQSDLEIIMTCMYDLHNRIQGYGEPQLDIVGYRGLDVMKEGGIGVCRNFAPNIADELNEINPEYNARLITVYVEEGGIINNNIPSRVIEEGVDAETLTRGKFISEILGNEQYVYRDGDLIRRITKNKDSIITEYYEDGRITKEKIVKEGEEIQILYDNEQKIQEQIIKKENEETKISYNDKGEIEREEKKINEEIDGIKYRKDYRDGNLYYYREVAENYYKDIYYNEDGSIRTECIADSNKQETYYYSMYGGYLFNFTVLEDGYETEIRYDENGQEISRETNKSNKENYYIENKETEEMMEQLEELTQLKEEQRENKKENRIPNHEIVAVDIDSDNITLLIDPTALALGIYKDGKIIILNKQDPEKETYLMSNILDDARREGTKKFVQWPIDYIKSFKNPTLSMEEIEEKYGLEAQNDMIRRIEERYSKKKTLREDIKIKDNITYDFDNNVVTIINDRTQENEDIEH